MIIAGKPYSIFPAAISSIDIQLPLVSIKTRLREGYAGFMFSV